MCYIIEHEISNEFGFAVNVVLRTLPELESMIEKYPFTKDEVLEAELLETESQYVSLFTHAPSQRKVEHLSAL